MEANVKTNNTQGAKPRGQFAQIWERFRRRGSAMFGLCLLILLVLVAIFADVLYDYDEVAIKQDITQRLLPPSWEHLFGTDDYGRDILARVVHGSRASLGIGFAAMLLGLIVGTIIGSTVGYYGGVLDMVVMRIVEVFQAIPCMLMAMIVVAIAGASAVTLAIALGIALVPTFTRVARGAVITVREMGYVESGWAIGSSDFRVIVLHILPNCFAPLLVQSTLSLAVSILSVSGLSYLGMGISPPTPEWGSMLSASRNYLQDNSYMAIFPGLAIMLTILALNLLGDGIRDAADPKLK